MEWENNAQRSKLNVNELIENNRRLREYNEELQLLLDKANEQLQKGNIPNVNRCWVDCNERLPDLIQDKDYSENVLAWCNNQLLIMCLFWVNGVDEHDSGYIWCQSYYIDGEGQSDDEYAPTHWMPLPKEPSGC